MELSGDWEVALTEITFPKSWFTIPRDGGKFTLESEMINESVPEFMQHEPFMSYVDMYVPSGYYASVKDVVDAINECIEKTLSETFQVRFGRSMATTTHTRLDKSKWPKLTYDEVSRKVRVELQALARIRFDQHLSILLGCLNNPVENNSEETQAVEGIATSDINGGIHNMYVYSDIVENVILGDTEAPLLRIVETAGSYGDIIHHSFDPLRFIPLRRKSFDSIEIDIRDAYGQPMSFESGILTVTIHIRRASSPYFL